MKIVERSSYDDRDCRAALVIEVDGEDEVSFIEGESEDASLNRDYSDCHSIVDLMKRAYEAGKAGEELVIERENVPWSEI